jgi:hypothetical protein
MENSMAIDKKLIDQLLTDYKTPEDIIGESAALDRPLPANKRATGIS